MDNQGVFINEREFIPYEKTNLPARYITFKTMQPVFWLVKLEPCIGQELAFNVEVANYDHRSLEDFKKQSFKPGSNIPLLFFHKINKSKFLQALSSYHPNKLPKDLFDPATTGLMSPNHHDEDTSVFLQRSRSANAFSISSTTHASVPALNIAEEYKISSDDIVFGDG